MDWLIDIWLIFLVAITIVFVIFAAKHVLFDDEELKRVPAEVIKKVLVVDDDEGFLNNLSEQLRDNHFQVCPASTVREAKQLMEQEHFRYVVTDLEMKTQNSEWGGIDVFKFLREKQLDANPIVLSGHSLNEIAEAGFPQEALDMQKFFISKGDPKRNHILAVLEMLNV